MHLERVVHRLRVKRSNGVLVVVGGHKHQQRKGLVFGPLFGQFGGSFEPA
jgi:hypothetical protein